MERVLIYLDKYSDEIMPAALNRPTLEGWAVWLSRGGERGNPDYEDDREESAWCFDPPADGAEYGAHQLTFEEDIIVRRSDDGTTVSYSRPIPDDIDFAAVRFGPGMGWDVDAILNPDSPAEIEEQLVDSECPLLGPGESEHLAIARGRNLRLVYRIGPPRLEVLGSVQ